MIEGRLWSKRTQNRGKHNKLNVGVLCSVPDSFLETPSSLSFRDVLVLSSLAGGSFVVSCTSSCSSLLPNSTSALGFILGPLLCLYFFWVNSFPLIALSRTPEFPRLYPWTNYLSTYLSDISTWMNVSQAFQTLHTPFWSPDPLPSLLSASPMSV